MIRTLCALVLLVTGMPAEAQLTAAAPVHAAVNHIPVAISADLTSEGDTTQLLLLLSREVPARAFLMERPDRVIVELPEVNFQLPAAAGRKREGLVSSFRYGLVGPGRSRIVVDLSEPALMSRLEVTSPAEGITFLRIELTRTDRPAFRNAAEAYDADPEVTASLAQPESVDHRPLVVIDPGHGGIDPGAVASSGEYEKDIVFGFADRLRRRLESAGRYRVLLTRDKDVFIPLDERVRIAREAKADLLISVHADSISAAPHVRGLTVYTGSEHASDTESQRLAERENKADAAAGLDHVHPPAEVTDILQDLTLRETRSFSQRFAQKVVGAIDSVMPLSKKPQRQAAFRVLRAPDVPSVLIELGYLTSRKDIDLLLSEAWRDRSTAAMLAAMDRFFAARVASRPVAPVSP